MVRSSDCVSISEWRSFVDLGATLSFGSDLKNFHRDGELQREVKLEFFNSCRSSLEIIEDRSEGAARDHKRIRERKASGVSGVVVLHECCLHEVFGVVLHECCLHEVSGVVSGVIVSFGVLSP